MKVSIFGLGYVGAVSAGCLARQGHTVIGVDPNATKVELINEGRSPIIKEGLGELIRDAVSAEKLRASADVRAAVEQSDISLICVAQSAQWQPGP